MFSTRRERERVRVFMHALQTAVKWEQRLPQPEGEEGRGIAIYWLLS